MTRSSPPEGIVMPTTRGHCDKKPSARGHCDKKPPTRGHCDKKPSTRGHCDKKPSARGHCDKVGPPGVWYKLVVMELADLHESCHLSQ